MKLTPEEFLNNLRVGLTEEFSNLVENPKTIEEHLTIGIKRNPPSLKYLVNHLGHTEQSAIEYLNTDYSDGFTICKKCGSYYYLGKGFTKHLSNGCLHCEGENKHRVFYVNKNELFPARLMSVMFDDGMSYIKDNLKIEKFKAEIQGL